MRIVPSFVVCFCCLGLLSSTTEGQNLKKEFVSSVMVKSFSIIKVNTTDSTTINLSEIEVFDSSVNKLDLTSTSLGSWESSAILGVNRGPEQLSDGKIHKDPEYNHVNDPFVTTGKSVFVNYTLTSKVLVSKIIIFNRTT